MRLRYYLRLLRDMLRVRIAETIEYKEDFALMIVVVPMHLFINLLFWSVIFSHARVIAGWTLGEVILLQAFMQLGFVFWALFLDFADDLDSLIISGELNTVLSKPTNPVLYLFVTGMNFRGVLWNLPRAVLYFLVAGWLGASISVSGLVAGTLLVFLGVVIVSTLVFIIQALSFWFGRTRALGLFYDLYFASAEYPITIFPAGLKFLFVMFLPVAFLTTGPAMASLASFPVTGIFGLFALAMLVLGVWFLAAWLVWKAGLKRYEAYGS